MELTIDHHRCDLGDRLPELPKYDATTLADVDTCRVGRSLKVTLPITDANDAVVCFARDPYTAARFNETIHTAEITADGALLFAGTARLLSTSETEYVFELRDGGAYWAQQAALAQFNTLAVDYQASLTPTTILDSWTDDTPVRFFPVHATNIHAQAIPRICCRSNGCFRSTITDLSCTSERFFRPFSKKRDTASKAGSCNRISSDRST